MPVAGEKQFVIIPSLQTEIPNAKFTITVQANQQVSLLLNNPPVEDTIEGEWTDETADDHAGDKNPKFVLVVSEPCTALVTLSIDSISGIQVVIAKYSKEDLFIWPDGERIIARSPYTDETEVTAMVKFKSPGKFHVCPTRERAGLGKFKITAITAASKIRFSE